jgi:hypothetical protein
MATLPSLCPRQESVSFEASAIASVAMTAAGLG